MQNYGVPFPAQSKEVQDKMKSTNLERYGVVNVFASEVFKEQIKNTIASKDDEWEEMRQERRKQTCLEKYGVDHCQKVESVREKAIQTNSVRYGVDHPPQNSDVRDRMKQTNLQKYGAKIHLHLK